MPARPVNSARSALLALRAAQMRAHLNPAEASLWSELRARKLGVQFRRQACIAGRCIVDFAAPKIRLVVEVDGAHHARRRHADKRRDRVLHGLGYRVLRLDAQLVLRELPVAVERLCEELRKLG